MYKAHLSQVLKTDDFPVRYAHDSSTTDALLRYNERLEDEASLTRLNEGFLESKLEELERLSFSQGRILWLTWARLTELTLLCAANYAENGYITEVGDLLFNPRRILVHIRSKLRPVVKERHTPLTVQFRHVATTRNGVIAWLKNNTILETVKEPVLPHLLDLLGEYRSASAAAYLASVRQRSVRIAELIGRLATEAVLPGQKNVQEGVTTGNQKEGKVPENRSCRFDWGTFRAFGQEIKATIQ